MGNSFEQGFTIWFTGLPCSGKTTLSKQIFNYLKKQGLKTELLDGDVIRRHFSQELGFSEKERKINIRRIGFLSHLLTRNGVVTVVAAIAPYKELREENRRLIGRYVEVYCNCPLEVAEQRDVKGMYQKARAGEIKNFTGVSDPYEAPDNPDIVIYTHKEPPETSISTIISYLKKYNYIK